MNYEFEKEDFQKVQCEENMYYFPENVKFLRKFWENLKQNKLGMFCCVVLVLLIISSVFAFLSPYDPDRYDLTNQFQGMSLKHWFGTDDLGRDYFTRALYGGRVSLLVGFFSMIISIFIGTLVGTISGYIGGKFDFVIMRGIDIALSLPSLLVIVVISAYTTPSMVSVILLIALFAWMGVARIVRAETITLKEREFILAAKLQGVPSYKIIVLHVIPNLVPVIIVAASLSVANAILTESALSFLGFGIPLPKASWGSMLRTAQTLILDNPILAVVPGILIMLATLSFNVIGEMLQITMNGQVAKKERRSKKWKKIFWK